MLPTNVGCQNTGSQIQGDENSVALAAQQTRSNPNPPVPPVPPVDECEECFAAAVTAGLDVELFLANLNVEGLTSIELVCQALLAGELNLGQEQYFNWLYDNNHFFCILRDDLVTDPVIIESY
jgi:hypothetical protein